MEGLGLIEIEAKRRAKIVRLTDEGFKVYEKFVDLLSLFEGVKMEEGDESSFQKLKEMEDRIEKIEDARPELLAPHLRDLQLMKREIKNKIILGQITVLENRIETKLNRY
jgi:DNA-binding MarR family transcriptional regulator